MKMLTREEVDALAVEALTAMPEATLDQPLLADLEAVSKVVALRDEVSPLMEDIVEHIQEAMDSNGPLTMLEAGVFYAAPEVNKHLVPKNELMALHFAIIACAAIVGRMTKEVDLPALSKDELHEKYLDMLQADLPDACMAATKLPRVQQLELAIAILERNKLHRQGPNHTGEAE